jgi:hypothetical protein
MTDIKPLATMKADDAAKIAAFEELIKPTSRSMETLPLPVLEKIGELKDCMRDNPNNVVSAGKLPENASITMAIAACKASPKLGSP